MNTSAAAVALKPRDPGPLVVEIRNTPTAWHVRIGGIWTIHIKGLVPGPTLRQLVLAAVHVDPDEILFTGFASNPPA
jgi:hypothetical protein